MHKKISIIAISLTLFSLVFAFAKPLTSRAQTPLPTAAEDLEVVQFDNSREDVNETLSDLGITIRLDKPEGAILAFSLPDVYILPDSKLYLVVKFWESLQLLWADTAEEKSDLLFHFSEKRLAETVQLLEEEKSEDAVVNLSRYRGQLSQALSHVAEIEKGAGRKQGYNRIGEKIWV